ncbi:PIN domain-containing protein [Agrobacterium genomosp. 13]|nr:PIN domain-containing protein [Agrobacterium genomosp. 13]
MFLLDTSVLSQAQYKKAHPSVAQWLADQEDLAIPFPALLEIQQGIVEIGARQPALAAEIMAWFDELLEWDFLYPEINHQVAKTLAKLHCCEPLRHLWYTNPENARRRKPGQDLFIAAVSIAHNLPIATLNGKDFALIAHYFPLPGVYNPAFSMWVVAKSDRPVTATQATAKYA